MFVGALARRALSAIAITGICACGSACIAAGNPPDSIAFHRDRPARSNSLPDSFFRGITEISGRISCRPSDLLAVMMRESGVRPDARNRTSGAVGLIQFLPSTLRKLGWTAGPDEFQALSPEEQLPWVEQFLQPSARYHLNTAGRLYQAVFMPASLRLPAGEEVVLMDSRGADADRYRRNRPLDLDGDGEITAGELQKSVEQCCKGAMWDWLGQRLADVDRSEPSVSDPSADAVPIQRASRGGGWRRNETLDRRRAAMVPAESEPIAAETSGRVFDLTTMRGISRALTALGYEMEGVSVANVLKSFQRREGLRADGIPGQKTRAILVVRLDEVGLTARTSLKPGP